MIKEFLLIIKKRFLIVFLVFWIVIVLAALFTFSRTEIFTATAGIILKSETLSAHTLEILSDEMLLKTARSLKILPTQDNEQHRRQAVVLLRSLLEVKITEQPTLLMIHASARSPDQAAYIANTHALVFIERFAGIEEPATTQEHINEIAGYFSDLKRKLSNIENASHIAKIEHKLKKRLKNARHERTRLRKTYTVHHPKIILLTRRIKELDLQLTQAREQRDIIKKTIAEVSKQGALIHRKGGSRQAVPREPGRGLLIPATMPDKPSYPHIPAIFAVSIVVGLILGIICALFIEQQNSFTGGLSDAESYLHIPVIGRIAHIERRTKTILENVIHFFKVRQRDKLGEKRSRLLFFHPLDSRLSNSYRKLLARFHTPHAGGRGSIVVCTSAGNREGKTTTALNTAILSALGGVKTLLCDMNLRYSAVHHLLGLPLQPGLTDIILRGIPYTKGIHTADDCQFTTTTAHQDLLRAGLGNLSIMTAGTPIKQIDRFMAGDQLGMMLMSLINEYQLILIDTSAVQHFDDTFNISACAIISRYGKRR